MEKKEKREIINSKSYSRDLFLIASDKRYTQVIAESRNVKPAPIVNQLKRLVKTHYLNEPVKIKLLNKTLYDINWKKIIMDFLDFLNDRNELIRDTHEDRFKGIEKEAIVLFMDYKENKKIYLKNIYLKLFFIEAFKKVSDSNLTIKELFNEIIKIHPLQLEEEWIWENNKMEKSKFLEGDEQLKNYYNLMRIASRLSSSYLEKDIRSLFPGILKLVRNFNQDLI